MNLNPDCGAMLEPFGEGAEDFFLAASLYHAGKISFGKVLGLPDRIDFRRGQAGCLSGSPADQRRGRPLARSGGRAVRDRTRCLG